MTRVNAHGEPMSNYIPSKTYGTGFGPLDSRIEWGRDENTGDLVMNVISQNGEHACGISFNRVAIADLIADLANSIR